MNTNKVYNINIFSTNLKIYIYKMKICLENITHAVSPVVEQAQVLHPLDNYSMSQTNLFMASFSSIVSISVQGGGQEIFIR